MTDPVDFTKLVPGFDFLQGLVKNAGSALPSIGNWVAPTLDPEELDKRVQELKTVQFWLEQNARMLGATIQALEVQRMTLSTLKTMNVQMGDLRDSLMIRPTGATAPAPRESRASEPAIKPAVSSPAPTSTPPPAGAAPATDTPAVPAVDPMQWWSALTKQFTELATSAMREGGTAMAAGTDALKQAATLPEAMAPQAQKPSPATRPSASAAPATKRPAAKTAKRPGS